MRNNLINRNNNNNNSSAILPKGCNSCKRNWNWLNKVKILMKKKTIFLFFSFGKKCINWTFNLKLNGLLVMCGFSLLFFFFFHNFVAEGMIFEFNYIQEICVILPILFLSFTLFLSMHLFIIYCFIVFFFIFYFSSFFLLKY